MILWRNIEIFHFLINLIPTADFPYFYYMLGGNLGVTFVRRCFRDDSYQPSVSVLEQDYEKMYTPVQSSFTVEKWGVGGSHLHGYVLYSDENSGKH